MIFVIALIFCGLLSCTFANDSCFNKTDYDFYIVEKLIEDVDKRMKYLKNNFMAAVDAHCPNTTHPNTACPDGWVSYKGTCLLFANDQTRNFQEAKDFCEQRGAGLLYVSDEAENNFIVGMLERLKQSLWFVGLTDKQSEGVWRWVHTNATAEYTAWSSGQPAGGTSENCVVYHYQYSFRWHDTGCSKNYYTICKKSYNGTGNVNMFAGSCEGSYTLLNG